jgi:arsenite methyltransferase
MSRYSSETGEIERAVELASSVEFSRLRAALYARALTEYPDARREEMALMQQCLAPRAGERILGLGEGNGFFCDAIASAIGSDGFYLVTDPSPFQLERLHCRGHANVQIQVAGAEAIEAAPESFDKAWSCGAFHHCADLTEALKRVFEVLRPGGQLVIVDVFQGTTLSQHFDAVVARYSATGHEVKFLSDEFAVSACVLAGFEEHQVQVRDTPIRWHFRTLRDMGRFVYALHGLTLLPDDEETSGYPNVIRGCQEILGVQHVGGFYGLHWPIKTLVARKAE